jgi:hypothetical protein
MRVSVVVVVVVVAILVEHTIRGTILILSVKREQKPARVESSSASSSKLQNKYKIGNDSVVGTKYTLFAKNSTQTCTSFYLPHTGIENMAYSCHEHTLRWSETKI